MMVMWHTIGPSKLTLELETKSRVSHSRVVIAQPDRKVRRD